MQKERSKKPPVFSLDYDSISLECTDSMEDFRVVQIANGNLKKECNDVEHDQNQNGGSVSQLALPSLAADWNSADRDSVVLMRIQVAK